MILVGKLPQPLYTSVGAAVPLLCVDCLLASGSPRGGPSKYLLVKRYYPPFAGEWWVPGGRVYRGESVVSAFKRIVLDEVGIDITNFIRLVGIYELRHEGEDDIPGGRHTVSVVLAAVVPEKYKVRLDFQSVDWKWADKLPKKFTVWEAL